jgi:hypothetical protein
MPTKYLTGRVRRGGSPRRSLKFEGGKEDDGHEIGKHVGKRTKKKQRLVTAGTRVRGKSLPLILAGVRLRGLCKHPNPIRREALWSFKEARLWYEMQQTCQRVGATDRKHESRVRSEDRDRER